MFNLKLKSKNCISCGICMDVCKPHAIEMRLNSSDKIEGDNLAYIFLHCKDNIEVLPTQTMTFPFLAFPKLCDGCRDCVAQCPAVALDLQIETNSF